MAVFLSANIPFFFWCQKNCFPFGNWLLLAYCSHVSIYCQSHAPLLCYWGPCDWTWPTRALFLGLTVTPRERVSLLPSPQPELLWTILTTTWTEAKNTAMDDHIFAKMSPVPYSLLWHTSIYKAIDSIFPPLESEAWQKWHCFFWD